MTDQPTDVTQAEVNAPKKRPIGLGRGLSALLGEIQNETAAPVPVGEGTTALVEGETRGNGIRMVDVSRLTPMPGQPRRTFDEEPIQELAQSIKTHGILQPIVVRDLGNGHYEIIAGERRWRASQVAQLHLVPVIVKDIDVRTALEIALVENVQREQLNAWEEGETYKRLVHEYGHSQEVLAKIVGKSRSHIANLMRLVHLPMEVHALLSQGEITMGHARAVLLCNDPAALARQVVDRRLNVRQTEALAKRFKPGAPEKIRHVQERNADIMALERQLSDTLGVKVGIVHGEKSGTVTLTYSSLDQLDMICQRLSGERI
jgi:ParB family transcriptional regulator, chromosome partitioning protein